MKTHPGLPPSPLKFALAAGALLLLVSLCRAADPAGVAPPLELPKPHLTGGRPLMEVLRDRHSTREYGNQPVPAAVLSDLLWAGFGVNRADGHRTAPSTMNLRSMDVYVCTAQGVYRYEATDHTLQPVAAADARPTLSGQDGVKDAPVHLVFVADHARMEKVAPAERGLYAWADTGFISQNIYLFCASQGLGTVVHALGNPAAISAGLHLRDNQVPILAQAVGYPKTPVP